MSNQRIRIRLKAFDHRLIDQSAKEIVETAKECKIILIMEKVETKEMYDTCKKVGIIYIQGFYLSEPADTLKSEMDCEN